MTSRIITQERKDTTFAFGIQVLHSVPNSQCHFEVNRSKIEVTKPKGPGAKCAIIHERMIMIVKLDGNNYCGASCHAQITQIVKRLEVKVTNQHISVSVSQMYFLFLPSFFTFFNVFIFLTFKK